MSTFLDLLNRADKSKHTCACPRQYRRYWCGIVLAKATKYAMDGDKRKIFLEFSWFPLSSLGSLCLRDFFEEELL